MNRNFMAIGLLLVTLLLGAFRGLAATISLYWEPSLSPDVEGYVVYYGNKSGDYVTRVDRGSATDFTFQPIPGSNYFFVVTAYTSSGLESLPSSEVAYLPAVNSNPMAAGTFNGLFDVAPSNESLGFFTLKKGTRNSFSGTVQISGRQYRFSGAPDPSGTINLTIKRSGTNSLLLTLNVDTNATDRLTGTLTDGAWTMNLTADRTPFSKTNAAPYVGKYTVAILGENSLPTDGIGFGSVRVLSNGLVKASGTLGDGKNFTTVTSLSQDGVWPFYVSPYGRWGGLISGWLQFETNGNESVHGDLNWMRFAVTNSRFYPNGFSNQVTLVGSTYVAPLAGTNVLNFTNGTLSFSSADWSNEFVKDILLLTNKILPAGSGEDRLSFNFRKDSGLFSGQIYLPDYKPPFRFRGALLQNQNAGYGLFLRTNQTGQVRLEPAL